MIKSITIFLLFSLYFSSLNLKYLKLKKMVIMRFAMKLFNCLCKTRPINTYFILPMRETTFIFDQIVLERRQTVVLFQTSLNNQWQILRNCSSSLFLDIFAPENLMENLNVFNWVCSIIYSCHCACFFVNGWWIINKKCIIHCAQTVQSKTLCHHVDRIVQFCMTNVLYKTQL